MKTFAHFNARSIDEAVSLLERYQGRGHLIAGGTDLLGKMKDRILPEYPEALINIKRVPGLNEIVEEDGILRVGPLAILEDITHQPVIKKNYTALAEAAGRAASPHLREMGTIGGNICQDIRCWYYRNPDNRFPCLRKGGGRCYALQGDNRYHSIFGGSVPEGCVAVHPSDVAPALIALGALIKTSKRTLRADQFFHVGVSKTTVLECDEMVTEIRIPKPRENAKSRFVKFALRKSIDFAIVNCAVSVCAGPGAEVEATVICLNSVYVKPYRAQKAEEMLLGKKITESSAEAAARLAVSEAVPLSNNGYMVQLAYTLVKRAILTCA